MAGSWAINVSGIINLYKKILSVLLTKSCAKNLIINWLNEVKTLHLQALFF